MRRQAYWFSRRVMGLAWTGLFLLAVWVWAGTARGGDAVQPKPDANRDPRPWRWTLDLSGAAPFVYDDEALQLPLAIYDAREVPDPEKKRPVDTVSRRVVVTVKALCYAIPADSGQSRGRSRMPRDPAATTDGVDSPALAEAQCDQQIEYSLSAEVPPYSREKPVRWRVVIPVEQLDRVAGGLGRRATEWRITLGPAPETGAPESESAGASGASEAKSAAEGRSDPGSETGKSAPESVVWASTRIRTWRVTEPAADTRSHPITPEMMLTALADVEPDVSGYRYPGGRWIWLTPRRSEAAARRWQPLTIWRQALTRWKPSAGRGFLSVCAPADFAVCPSSGSILGGDADLPAAYPVLLRNMYRPVPGAPPVYVWTLAALRAASAWSGRPEDILLFPGAADARAGTSPETYAMAVQTAAAAFDSGHAARNRGRLFLATPPPDPAAGEWISALAGEVREVARERHWRLCDLSEAFDGIDAPSASVVPGGWTPARARAVRRELTAYRETDYAELALAATPMVIFGVWVVGVLWLWRRARWKGFAGG